jgi:hypothetical protein
MAEIPGGGYILTGQAVNTSNGRSTFLIRTDTAGNMLWYKTYSAQLTSVDVLPLCVAANMNKEFIVMGQMIDAQNVMHMYFFMTDSMGNLKWFREKLNVQSEPHVLVHNGNGFMYGGYHNTGGSLGVLDSAMNGMCDYVNLNIDVLTYNYTQSNVIPTSPITSPQVYIIPLPFTFYFNSKLLDTILCPQQSNPGVNEYDLSNLISIYPNPTSGEFQIQIVNKQYTISHIEIYNILGEQVYSANKLIAEPVIDISAHPNGIYLVRVQTNEGTISKKIIIAR